MKLYNNFDYTDYIELLESIDAELITFDELLKLEFIDKRYLIIRHDVDRDLFMAYKIAKYEHKHDIQSTYFVLHTADYFDYSKQMISVCREIQDFGHNIGFHNDALGEHLKTGNDIKFIINKPLNFLRKHKIFINGVSSHGCKDCYEKGFLNYEIWKEFNSNINQGFMKHNMLNKFFLKEFGFDYEAYFLDYDYYLSECGGNWNTYKWSGVFCLNMIPKLFERGLKHYSHNKEKDIIKQFNKESCAVIQLLTHTGLTWSFVTDYKSFYKSREKKRKKWMKRKNM